MNKEYKTIGQYIEALADAGLLAGKTTGGASCGADLAGALRTADKDALVRALSYNSKDVQAGTLFVCKGMTFKPEYLAEAIASGATAYVCEAAWYNEHAEALEKLGAGAAAITVSDIRKAMPVVCGAYYGKLSDRIKIIGITGTKGKTTAIYFTKAIVEEYFGKSVAFSSGIDIYDGVTLQTADLTTPEVMDLYKYIDTAIDAGQEFYVLEISSQALKYGRVAGLDLAAATILNINRDHISPREHPDLADYKAAKLMIYNHCGIACRNLDCDFQDEIAEAVGAAGQIVTYSRFDKSANITSDNITTDHGRAAFDLRIQGIEGRPDAVFRVQLAAFGEINVENALAAAALTYSLGIPTECIAAGLGRAVAPGRFQLIEADDGSRFGIVDYAHNTLSFSILFDTLEKEFPDMKYTIVFGSPGSKAINRREDLGRIAGARADLTIITEEDYADEDPYEIAETVAGFVREEGGEYEIEVDRGKAIKRALELADDNTIVIVAGKGSEKWLRRGPKSYEVPSDVEYMQEYINMK